MNEEEAVLDTCLYESEITKELVRLTVLQQDIDRCRDWASAAQAMTSADQPPSFVVEALNEAALLALCRAFDGTKGDRAQPLNPQRIYSPVDRKILRSLVKIRNRLVAHDEGIAHIGLPLIVRDENFEATLVQVMVLGVHFSSTPESKELVRLCELAQSWIAREREKLGLLCKNEFNALPVESRRSFGPAQIRVDPKDPFW